MRINVSELNAQSNGATTFNMYYVLEGWILLDMPPFREREHLPFGTRSKSGKHGTDREGRKEGDVKEP